MKPVSASYEIATLKNAVEGAITLIELHRLGGLEDEDIEKSVVALLGLVACHLRDLGRVMRGAFDVEQFAALFNAAPDDGVEAAEKDVILGTALPKGPRSKRHR